MATEDLCLVCTDSLDYAGIGPCGHKEVCSRCVARLRFVMDDTRCSLCKQDAPAVLFTRFMGDYTATLPPAEYERLQARASAGELWALPEVGGFFDDQDHFKLIKGLCSFTHPMAAGAAFNSLPALKRRLADAHKLHFCDLCVKGRKVFISEQVLYSSRDLERHNRTGDDTGPLAEAGFKGHPSCRFCRRRFFDGDELYRHMESAHEHCFICRRTAPNKFVYFRDYEELDGHFQSDHHPCPHPSCLERRFVVFPEEQDLRRHFATEHAGDAGMSRAQRRQAMSLNIQLTYSSREEQDHAAAAAAAAARPGVVIGGGAGLQRSGRSGRGGSSMRHSHSEGAMAQALQASMDSSRAEAAGRGAADADGPSSVTFSADDFPSVSGQGGGSGAAPLGTWLGAGGGAGGGRGALTNEDFPALPTASRNQRRRQRERERNVHANLAARLAAASAPIRVVNRASAAAAAAPTPAEAAAGGGMRHSRSANALPGSSSGFNSSAAPSAAGSDSDDGGADDTDDADTAPASSADHFPALPGGHAAAAAGSAQAHPGWVPVRRSGKPPRPGQAGGSSSNAAPAAAPTSIADFPSLAAALPARSRGGGGAAAAGASKSKAAAAGSSSKGAAAAAARPATVADAVAAAGGVSDELKAANRLLIERCKAALTDDAFADFRARSGAFMAGGLSAAAYHGHCLELGLLQLVPELAALCPDPSKRTALLEAHRGYLQQLAASGADLQRSSGTAASKAAGCGGGLSGWVPPEAALAALAEAEAKGSWACERCTLINAPSSRACEVCSAPQPKRTQQTGPSAAAVAARGTASSRSSGVSKAAAAASGGGSGASWSAAAAGASSSSSGSGGQASGSSKGQQQPTSARPAAPPPAAPDSWPSLDGGRGGGAGSSSAAASQAAGADRAAQQQPQPAAAAAGPSGGKKKKPAKQPLSELLATGKSQPGNAWSQQQRMSAVTTAPPAARGEWAAKNGGGAKLAKRFNAINEAWGGGK